MLGISTNIWVLVDGEYITAVANSRNEVRSLRREGATGVVRRAVITLV